MLYNLYVFTKIHRIFMIDYFTHKKEDTAVSSLANIMKLILPNFLLPVKTRAAGPSNSV